MARVIVGMSGGVDSSVTAAVLKQAGHDVVGVTLNVWPDLPTDAQREDACCALGAVEDARRVADRLDIPYYVLNFREVFEEHVIKDFVRTYASGRTPNPCIRCNQFIKFDALLVKARQLGAEYVATGHYARIEHCLNSPHRLRKAVDPSKDQSYVLYVMTQPRLASALLPLGEHTKAETRQLAADLGLGVANKPESQDICFVPFKRYGEFIELYAPEVLQPGPIVNQQGEAVGEHRGLALHTIGQRRGLGIATGEPVFVTDLLPDSNTVVVGPPEALLSDACWLEEVNWIEGEPPAAPVAGLARARYRAAEVACSVVAQGGGLQVTFVEPQRAITPGQALVVYDAEGYVLGGGTIARRTAAPRA